MEHVLAANLDVNTRAGNISRLVQVINNGVCAADGRSEFPAVTCPSFHMVILVTLRSRLRRCSGPAGTAGVYRLRSCRLYCLEE